MKFYLFITLIFGSLLQTQHAKVVLLDSYYNNEQRVDSTGRLESWHYKWNETDNDGFSLLASVFNKYGFKTDISYEKPSAPLLKKINIYIIVDPDSPAESPHPNFIKEEEATLIYNWVRKGGVLVLLGNDSANTEFKHLNHLANKFGIHFNQNSRNHVNGNHYTTGGILVPEGNSILKDVNKIYMKGISTLTIKAPAKAILTEKEDIIIAVSKIGKGTVFAAGDPWLYNEYTDGKILSTDFQNHKAALNLVAWLKEQTSKK